MTGSRGGACPARLICALLYFSLAPAAGQAPVSASASPSAPVSLPSIALGFGHFSGTPDHAIVQEPRLSYGGELTLRADGLTGNLLRQQYDLTGSVRAHEADTTLTAESLHFDGLANQGLALRALLTQRPYTVRARQIAVTASEIVAQQAEFTTAPPNVRPDLDVRAQSLSLFPARRHGELRNASFYLFHARVLTLPRVGFSLGSGAGNSGRQGNIPTVGYSGRYGAYLAIGGGAARSGRIRYRVVLPARQSVQARVTSEQTLFFHAAPGGPPPVPVAANDYLGALRKLATARRPPLPEHDPLLFHDFLPDPNPIRLFDGPPATRLSLGEELSTHIEATGRRMDNLYVSRLPEVTLNGQQPLAQTDALPRAMTAEAFRSALRQIVPVVTAQAAAGAFREQPANIRAQRARLALGLSTRPLLVAPNTVILPFVQTTANAYNVSGLRSRYNYAQFGMAVNHYFSDRSAIGLQYVGSKQSGDSPFNFDVIDTSRELDGRIQVGNRRLAVAGQVRYDLTRGGVIDYKLAVAPGLAGLTPIFSYNFRNRSVGVGVAIEGITF